MYCFATSISHGVEKYFPRLWCTGISDAIFSFVSGHEELFKYCLLGKCNIDLIIIVQSVYVKNEHVL